MASAECRESAARDDPGRGPHYRDRSCRERTRSSRVQIRPTVRSLPWPRATTELVRRQGPSWAYLKDGQRLPATNVGRRGHLCHTTSANHRHSKRGLGALASRTQANAARHRRHRQQDSAYSLGVVGEGRRLQGRSGHLNTGGDSGTQNVAMKCKGRSER